MKQRHVHIAAWYQNQSGAESVALAKGYPPLKRHVQTRCEVFDNDAFFKAMKRYITRIVDQYNHAIQVKTYRKQLPWESRRSVTEYINCWKEHATFNLMEMQRSLLISIKLAWGFLFASNEQRCEIPGIFVMALSRAKNYLLTSRETWLPRVRHDFSVTFVQHMLISWQVHVYGGLSTRR